MLVLTYKEGDTIHIGDDITIHFPHLRRSRGKVSIEAPRNIRVLRGKVAEQQRDQEEAEKKLRNAG